MRLLLDECTPQRLRRDFTGHTVATVEEAGFKGLKNSQLLAAIVGSFDVLVTVDQNLPHQQNLASYCLSILLLVAKSNRYADLKPLVPQALKQLKRGDIARIA